MYRISLGDWQRNGKVVGDTLIVDFMDELPLWFVLIGKLSEERRIAPVPRAGLEFVPRKVGGSSLWRVRVLRRVVIHISHGRAKHGSLVGCRQHSACSCSLLHLIALEWLLCGVGGLWSSVPAQLGVGVGLVSGLKCEIP